MKKSFITLIAILLMFSTAAAQEYAVGEGDLLKITVYQHPDLATEVRIGGDGQITFPLIGMVEVQGLTVSEVERKIRLKLQDGYLRKAHVSVFIEEYKSKKVTVLGEFVKPGIVELSGNSTLLEVISSAGGITPNAGDTLFIQRKIFRAGTGKGKDITVTVALKKLLEEGDVSANVSVQDGDSIYVPRAGFVFVSGEVRNPGAYKITKGLTVLKAITLAGGFTEKAWKKKTHIIRNPEGKGEVTVEVNMEDLVEFDDMIAVPASFF